MSNAQNADTPNNIFPANFLGQNRRIFRHLRILSQNIVYGVKEVQYKRQKLNLKIACISWIGVILACICIMITDLYNSSPQEYMFNYYQRWLLPLVIASLTTTTVAALCIANINLVRPIQLFTTIVISIYFLTATGQYLASIDYQWILALTLTLFEVVVGLMFLKDKRKVVIPILIGAQIVAICLKVDGVAAGVSWLWILIVPIVFACCAVVGCFILAGGGVKCYKQKPGIRMPVVGHCYKSLTMLSIGLCLGLLCYRILFLDNTLSMTLGVVIYHILLLFLFICKFQKDIVLYQAKAQRKLSAKQIQPVDFQATYSKTVFKKLSHNWVVLQQQATHSIQSQSHLRQSELNPEPILNTGQCAICMTDCLSLVWIPCGHLVACESCGKYLRDNGKLECIICKAKCTHIYHLASNQGKSTIEYLSDYYFRVVQKQ